MKSQPWTVSLAVIVALTSGCSGGSPEPKAALLDAAERTKSADSFHVDSLFVAPDVTQEGQADYVAPDRFRMQGSGEGAATSIYIGRDSYVTGPENVNRFFHYEEPCNLGIEGFFPAIELVGFAEHVDRVGETYRFTIEGEGNPEGEARIEGGYIVSLVVRYDLTMMGEVEERHTLSDFGSDIRIEPPPVSQLEPDEALIDLDAVSEGLAPDCSTVWEPPG